MKSTVRRSGELVVPLVLILSFALDLAAQKVTGVSGEIHLYRSPMVIDVTAGELAVTPRMEVPSLADHSCRGVELNGAVIEWIVRKHPKVTLRIIRLTGKMFNNSGKDKTVLIVLQAREGEAVLADANRKVEPFAAGVKVPAGESASFDEDVALPLAYLTPQAGLKLRLTVTVKDY